MMRGLLKSALFLTLVLAGAVGLWVYQMHHSAAYEIQRLQEEKQKLQHLIDRLTDDRRVAELLVIRQGTVQRDGQEIPQTTILFVEYDRNNAPLPGKTFIIEGNTVHIEAMVIKFDRGFIAADDALRGRGIALFRRIFGDRQTPDQAFPIDTPGSIPEVYRAVPGESDDLAEFQKELWANFWRLTEDSGYRAEKGVRLADGQGVWGPLSPDRLYTLTLSGDGDLSLTSEPIKGIYGQALKMRRPLPQ